MKPFLGVVVPEQFSIDQTYKVLSDIKTQTQNEGDNPYIVKRGGTQPESLFSYIGSYGWHTEDD